MYLHVAEFLGDAHFLDVKPILLICGPSQTVGGNSDSSRIPRIPGFNAL
jgi:hypothetical protein